MFGLEAQGFKGSAGLLRVRGFRVQGKALGFRVWRHGGSGLGRRVLGLLRRNMDPMPIMRL